MRNKRQVKQRESPAGCEIMFALRLASDFLLEREFIRRRVAIPYAPRVYLRVQS